MMFADLYFPGCSANRLARWRDNGGASASFPALFDELFRRV
jgi:hypothetical protein